MSTRKKIQSKHYGSGQKTTLMKPPSKAKCRRGGSLQHQRQPPRRTYQQATPTLDNPRGAYVRRAHSVEQQTRHRKKKHCRFCPPRPQQHHLDMRQMVLLLHLRLGWQQWHLQKEEWWNTAKEWTKGRRRATFQAEERRGREGIQGGRRQWRARRSGNG